MLCSCDEPVCVSRANGKPIYSKDIGLFYEVEHCGPCGQTVVVWPQASRLVLYSEREQLGINRAIDPPLGEYLCRPCFI
jgi:hypothetical protein